MGLDVQEHVRRVEVNFSEEEIKEYEKVFQRVSKSKTGCVSSLDLRNMLKEMGEEVSDKQLHDVIAEVDTNRNSCVELDEFLQVRNTRQAALYSPERQLPLARTKVYKLVPTNLMLGVTLRWTSIRLSSGNRNTPNHPMLQKPKSSGLIDHTDRHRLGLFIQVANLCRIERIDIYSFVSLSQVMSALKTGAIANNRFAVIIERHHKHLTDEIPVDRSGGGL